MHLDDYLEWFFNEKPVLSLQACTEILEQLYHTRCYNPSKGFIEKRNVEGKRIISIYYDLKDDEFFLKTKLDTAEGTMFRYAYSTWGHASRNFMAAIKHSVNSAKEAIDKNMAAIEHKHAKVVATYNLTITREKAQYATLENLNGDL